MTMPPKLQPDFLPESLPEGWSVRILDEAYRDPLHELLAACDDFSVLVSGRPTQIGDALGLLYDLPPGRTSADKQVYGFLDQQKDLIGVLDLVSCYPQDSACFIGLFLLHPSLRGKGLGRAIISALADFAGQAGFMEIMLGVVEENQAALRFWEACGFEVVEKSPPRQIGLKTHHVLRMRKNLQSAISSL